MRGGACCPLCCAVLRRGAGLRRGLLPFAQHHPGGGGEGGTGAALALWSRHRGGKG